MPVFNPSHDLYNCWFELLKPYSLAMSLLLEQAWDQNWTLQSSSPYILRYSTTMHFNAVFWTSGIKPKTHRYPLILTGQALRLQFCHLTIIIKVLYDDKSGKTNNWDAVKYTQTHASKIYFPKKHDAYRKYTVRSKVNQSSLFRTFVSLLYIVYPYFDSVRCVDIICMNELVFIRFTQLALLALQKY